MSDFQGDETTQELVKEEDPAADAPGGPAGTRPLEGACSQDGRCSSPDSAGPGNDDDDDDGDDDDDEKVIRPGSPIMAPQATIDRILARHSATPPRVRNAIRRMFAEERHREKLCQNCASFQNIWADTSQNSIVRAICMDCCRKLSEASQCRGGHPECAGFLAINSVGLAAAPYCVGCLEAEKASYRCAVGSLPAPPSVHDVFADDGLYKLLCYACATFKNIRLDASPPLSRARAVVAAFCEGCQAAVAQARQHQCQGGYDECLWLIQCDSLGAAYACCAYCESRNHIRAALGNETDATNRSASFSVAYAIPPSVRSVFRDDEQYVLLCRYCAMARNFKPDPWEEVLVEAFCEGCRGKLASLGKERCSGTSLECIGKLWYDALGAPATLCTKCYAQKRRSGWGRTRRRTSRRANRQRGRKHR